MSKNPYGKPGKGNYDEAWRSVVSLPCKVCGATSKSLKLYGKKLLISCDALWGCDDYFENPSDVEAIIEGS